MVMTGISLLPSSLTTISCSAAAFAALVPDVLSMIFLGGCAGCAGCTGCDVSPVAFFAFGKAPNGAMFPNTPKRINPASSKLGLLCTEGSSHLCMNDREPSLAEFLETSSGLVASFPVACCAGLENREADREARVFDDIIVSPCLFLIASQTRLLPFIVLELRDAPPLLLGLGGRTLNAPA